jgi:hypothetical protein
MAPRNKLHWRTNLMTHDGSSANNLKQKRLSSRLNAKLDSNLFAYAVTAGAAGVAMMAMTQGAEAKVVATPAHIVIPTNGTIIDFDINGDGQTDFGLQAFGSSAKPRTKSCSNDCSFGSDLLVVPTQTGNEVVDAGTTSYYGEECAADLAAGKTIGPVRPFATGREAMFAHLGTIFGFNTSRCPWQGNHPPAAFLGVKFLDLSGRVHYGWVRVSVTDSVHATITGYAYETVPNKALTAGATDSPTALLSDPELDSQRVHEHASLAMLALGAPGLAAWRKRDEEKN